MSSEMSTRVLIQLEHMLEGFQTMGAPHVQQSTVACVPGMRAFSPVATSVRVKAVLGSMAAVDICAKQKKSSHPSLPIICLQSQKNERNASHCQLQILLRCDFVTCRFCRPESIGELKKAFFPRLLESLVIWFQQKGNPVRLLHGAKDPHPLASEVKDLRLLVCAVLRTISNR
jgi:hypothetical protein